MCQRSVEVHCAGCFEKVSKKVEVFVALYCTYVPMSHTTTNVQKIRTQVPRKMGTTARVWPQPRIFSPNFATSKAFLRVGFH
jgi:hypothetical protein